MSKAIIMMAALALSWTTAHAEVTENEVQQIKSGIHHKLLKSWRIPTVTYKRKTTTSVVSFDRYGNVINIYLPNPATSKDAEAFHWSIKNAIKRASPFDVFKNFEITESDVEKHFTNMEIKFTTPDHILNEEWK